MNIKKFLSVPELAKLLNISRIAVYKRIKAGQIRAMKVGRNYVIDKGDLGGVLSDKLTEKDKETINNSVKKTVKEYGETLRLLGTV